MGTFTQRVDPPVIAVVLMFGPCHGQTHYTQGPLQQQMFFIAGDEPQAMFQEYKFGEPYGPPRPSMMSMNRHVYALHDVFDQGTEEGALYFHDENCCEKDYSKSRDYKRNGPIDRDKLPRFKDPVDMFDRPRPKKRPKLGDPTREVGE